jgi:hypothetical protein
MAICRFSAIDTLALSLASQPTKRGEGSLTGLRKTSAPKKRSRNLPEEVLA